MRPTAPGPGLRSGCHCDTRRRQAALASRSLAPGARPSSLQAVKAVKVSVAIG